MDSKRNSRKTEYSSIDGNSPNRLVIVEESEAIYYGFFSGQQPVELYCEQKAQRSLVGRVYAASVNRVAEGISGAFLHTVDGDCFLPGVSGLKGGDILPVQIFKDGIGRKLPVAGTNISIQGKYFVFTFGLKRIGVSKKIKNQLERERLSAFMKEEADRVSGRSVGNAEPVIKDMPGGNAEPIIEDGPVGTAKPVIKNEPVGTVDFKFGVVARTNAEGIPDSLLRREFRELYTVCRRISDKAGTAVGGSLLYRQPPHYIQLGQDLPSGELDEIVTDSESIFQEWKETYSGREEGGLADRIRLYQDNYPLKKLYRLEHHFQAACQRHVWLKSGGSIVIEHTEAMTVIDVNSGAVTRSRKKAEQIFLSMNLEAAEEIARQLRLRNISGIILVDFINMRSQEDRDQLMKTLSQYCSTDRTRIRVIDYTALGLVEMTRDKSRKPLHAQLGKSFKPEQIE